MIQRILVPLDGSELAETILPYASYLATRAGSSIQLLSVAENEAERGKLNEYLRSRLDRFASVETSAVVTLGDDEAGEILQQAETLSADLIAMSTHGRSGVTRWVFGSVADKVIHASAQPLLLVRARRPEEQVRAPQIERILVPLDGSELSMSVLPFVESLAKALDATLVLFHGVVPVHIYPSAEMVAPPTTLLEDLLEQARSYIATVEEEVKARGVRVQGLTTMGFPVDEIVRAADEAGAGLIAMATHGRSGLNRWIMGSVVDGVVRRTNLPCLLMRPKGLAEQE